MIPDTAQLLAAPPWLLDLIDTSTRVTVLMAAAAVTVALLRRAPAQARHLVWTLSLAGALLLPLVALVLPAWQLRILPAASARPAPAPLGTSPRASAFELDEAPAPPAQAVVAPARRLEAPAQAKVRPSLATRVLNDMLAPLAPAPRTSTLPLSLDRWLLALWLAGISLVLGRVAFDRVQVWYLARRSHPVADERAERFALLQRRLGLSRVTLVELHDVELPMTWGVLRPMVALPASSRRWSGARLDAVMLHELAHVRRRDALSQLLASLACALYWFHPLTWFAGKQMRVLREYACDDEVLGQGVRPSSYAEELIGIVQALRREERESTATLAMARRSQLGERLLALLDPGIRHARLRRGPATALSAGALVLLVSAATVRPAAAEGPAPLPRLTPAEAAQRQGELPAAASPEAPSAAPATPRPAAAAAPPAAPRTPTPSAVAAPAAAPAPTATPAPSSSAPPALAEPTPAPAEGFRDDSGDLVEPVRAKRHPRARGDDEELGRLEAMRKSSGGDERTLTRSLRKLAHDADFETETSRQAYLAATASISDDGLRWDALKALLEGAPISVETGRGVLAQAQRFERDKERGALLSMMHHLKESDLVRGPLASAYLDVAGQLQASSALARALRELLHPERVPTDAVLKALALLQRVPEPKLRKAVLVEVTDHQDVTPAVEAAYTALTHGFDASALEDAAERLAEAKGEAHSRRRGSRWAFSWTGPGPGEAAGLSGARRAELERMRAEIERELGEERQALRRSQEQLQESARQLQRQAEELGRKYQEKARALEEKLRRQFGPDAQPGPDAP